MCVCVCVVVVVVVVVVVLCTVLCMPLCEPRSRGYKTFFMLNSAEQDIFSADKYVNNNNSFSYLLAEKVSFSAMFSKKEFSICSNLGF